jgi:hypothetical protein
MYRRPKFLEVLLQIREQMAREADYDVDRFTEMIRSNGRKGFRLSLTAEGGQAENGSQGAGPLAREKRGSKN